MPELPEVEHVVRALRRAVLGRQIVASEIRLPKLISPAAPSAFKGKLKGSRISGVSRRGKFILIELDSGKVLVVHLRMTGKFLVLTPDDSLPRHVHAVFYLDDERRLVFRDQRQFGVMKLVANSRLSKTKGITNLAPEPFSDEFNIGYLKETLAKSRRTLKALLLDQTRVVGLGNIYAAEALFRARINPFKTASELSAASCASAPSNSRCPARGRFGQLNIPNQPGESEWLFLRRGLWKSLAGLRTRRQCLLQVRRPDSTPCAWREINLLVPKVPTTLGLPTVEHFSQERGQAALPNREAFLSAFF